MQKNKDYKAFIVEGEAREPQVIDNISKVFFKNGNFKIITLPAGENIYMLWKKLKSDNFDTDIIEVLRESNKKIREQLAGLSRDDFSEVFLFFDYDARQINLGKADDGDVLNQMLESFDNKIEDGKLYISYPTVALHWEKYFQHIREKYNNIYKVQMPKVSLHVCRHTFCSNMTKS